MREHNNCKDEDLLLEQKVYIEEVEIFNEGDWEIYKVRYLLDLEGNRLDNRGYAYHVEYIWIESYIC